MGAGPGKIVMGGALLAALAIVPHCAQSRIDGTAVEKADAAAAEARDAARRAQGSADEAAEAAKVARHAVGDIRPAEGPGS